jgi:hypothetical protein
MDGPVMDRELAQYGTTLETCRRRETVHLSLMWRTLFSCNHQYALGLTISPPTIL